MSLRYALLLFPFLFLSLPLYADATPGTAVIGSDVWARPRSGAELAHLPQLRELVEMFERQPDGTIVVYHGTGEEPGLWAEELRSWLAALGIPSARVRLEPDPALERELRLEVRAYGGDS